MEAIWVDEARARVQLKLLAAIAGGQEGLDSFEDPADLIADVPEPEPERAGDPAARAAQVADFLAAIR